MAINYIAFRLEDGEVFAQVSQSAAERTTLKIPNRDGTADYPKVITEKMQTINLTPYLRADLTYKPFYTGEVTSITGTLPVVTVSGRPYMSTFNYWGQTAEKTICSDLPYRLITAGQPDVVSAILQPNQSAPQLAAKNLSGASSMFAKSIVRASGDAEVNILDANGNTVAVETIRYVDRPMGLNGVRLAWLNRYGAIDIWNFDHLREQTYTAKVDKIYTADGYKNIGAETETQTIVESRELPKDALEALSYILCSPAVWLVKDVRYMGLEESHFTPIDIISDSCRVYSDAELSTLEIAYRKNKREKW